MKGSALQIPGSGCAVSLGFSQKNTDFDPITIEELTGIECEVDFVTIEQVDEPQETDKAIPDQPPVRGQPPAHPGCELKSALHIRHLRRRREQ